MRKSILALLVTASLAGCSSVPSAPEKPDGLTRITINSPRVVADVMSQYYRALAAQRPVSSQGGRLVKTTIAEVLEKHIPADFKIYVIPGVDLATPIEYDSARSWTESFGKPLADAGIDMTANLGSKVMELKLADTTIAQVLDRYVPEEYQVFTDDGVNLGAVVTFDRKLPWAEALGKALGSVGVGFTANLNEKLILLRQKPGAVDDQVGALGSTTPSEGRVANAKL